MGCIDRSRLTLQIGDGAGHAADAVVAAAGEVALPDRQGDTIGGVDITVTEPMVDTDSGTNFQPGNYKMTGESLLAYTRDRKSYPAEGDRRRTVNQGRAIIAALTTLRAQDPGAAGTAKLVATVARHVKTEGLDLAELYDLGRLALSIDPARIKNVLLPTGSGSGTNLSVAPEAQDLFADFRDDAILQSH